MKYPRHPRSVEGLEAVHPIRGDHHNGPLMHNIISLMHSYISNALIDESAFSFAKLYHSLSTIRLVELMMTEKRTYVDFIKRFLKWLCHYEQMMTAE